MKRVSTPQRPIAVLHILSNIFGRLAVASNEIFLNLGLALMVVSVYWKQFVKQLSIHSRSTMAFWEILCIFCSRKQTCAQKSVNFEYYIKVKSNFVGCEQFQADDIAQRKIVGVVLSSSPRWRAGPLCHLQYTMPKWYFWLDRTIRMSPK